MITAVVSSDQQQYFMGKNHPQWI